MRPKMLDAVIARSRLSADRNYRAARQHHGAPRPLSSAAFHDADEFALKKRGGCLRHHPLAFDRLALQNRFHRSSPGEMEPANSNGGITHASVDNDPCERCQCFRIVAGGPDRCGERRNQFPKRESLPRPRPVYLLELVLLQQDADPDVLGTLTVGPEQPRIRFLASLGAGRVNRLKARRRMTGQVGHNPQLERMNSGQIPLIVQVELIGSELPVVFFYLVRTDGHGVFGCSGLKLR